MHPAFVPYARWLGTSLDALPPDADRFDAFARECGLALPDGRALRIRNHGATGSALDYESAIARDAMLAVRVGDWHDAFNALAWLAFPRTKAALNARHVAEGSAPTPNARSRVRDAATLLDEYGLLLGCDDATLPPLLFDHAWHALFVARAADVRRHFFPVVIGHGLLDRLRKPYRELTAKVLVVPFESGALRERCERSVLDAKAALLVEAAGFAPDLLAPLPVAALPGWDAERLGERLFDDVSVFRPKLIR